MSAAPALRTSFSKCVLEFSAKRTSYLANVKNGKQESPSISNTLPSEPRVTSLFSTYYRNCVYLLLSRSGAHDLQPHLGGRRILTLGRAMFS